MRLVPLAAILACLLALPATASAATSLGQTTNDNLGCPDATLAQVTSARARLHRRRARASSPSCAPRTRTPACGCTSCARAAATPSPCSPRSRSRRTTTGSSGCPPRAACSPATCSGSPATAGANCLVPGDGHERPRRLDRRPPSPDTGEATLADREPGPPQRRGDARARRRRRRLRRRDAGPLPRRRLAHDARTARPTSPSARRLVERDDGARGRERPHRSPSATTGRASARDVRIVEPIPHGLQLVTTTPTSGGCAGGAPVDCTLPTVAAGRDRDGPRRRPRRVGRRARAGRDRDQPDARPQPRQQQRRDLVRGRRSGARSSSPGRSAGSRACAA